jgi:hypothetical protein
MPRITYKDEAGEKVPSVSAILNMNGGVKAYGLQHWYWKKGADGLGYKEMPEANIGTIAHLLIEADIKGKDLDLSQFPMEHVAKAKNAFRNYLIWKKRVNYEPIESEISLVSEKHKFGGTPDAAALIDNLLSIPDWKSGKDLYADTWMQVVAYQKLWDENFPDNPITGGYHVLRTGKEDAMFEHTWRALDCKTAELAWEWFLNLRRNYDLEQEMKTLN